MDSFGRRVWHGVGEGIGLAGGVLVVVVLLSLLTPRPAQSPQPVRDPRLVAAGQVQPAVLQAGAAKAACANPWL